MIYILAHTFRDAKRCAATGLEVPLAPTQWTYLHETKQLHGRRGQSVILFGNYKSNPNWLRLLPELKFCEAETREMTDKNN